MTKQSSQHRLSFAKGVKNGQNLSVSASSFDLASVANLLLPLAPGLLATLAVICFTFCQSRIPITVSGYWFETLPRVRPSRGHLDKCKSSMVALMTLSSSPVKQSAPMSLSVCRQFHLIDVALLKYLDRSRRYKSSEKCADDPQSPYRQDQQQEVSVLDSNLRSKRVSNVRAC